MRQSALCKCARAHFTSRWPRPSHRPPQGRPALLLRACTIYALGGEWREPAAEGKLCVHVPRQAHTRTRACACNPMISPGEEIPRKAGCRREQTTKRLQMEANITAHAWLTPAKFFLYALREEGHAPRLRSRPERASEMHPQAPKIQTFLPACLLPTACDYNGLDCFDPLDLQAEKKRRECFNMMYVCGTRYSVFC